MAVKFKADGVLGRAAIYEDSDDAPFDNPRANLNRVHFHSDLDYIAFTQSTPSISTSVTIDGSQGFYYRATPHNLGGHGRSGIPFVYGRIYARGAWIPLCGTIPVYEWSSNTQHNIVCVTLAVDATNVYLAETRSHDSEDSFTTFSAPVEIFVSEVFAPT